MNSPPLRAAMALSEALGKASVRFCHWKSNDHLAAALAGKTDIDLFVNSDDRAAFEHVAVEAGCLKILSQPWGRYPEVEDWLLLDSATGEFLHLHVHFALMTGLKRVKHLKIPWEGALLSHLRSDVASGWPIPIAEMEMLILLVRIWAKMPPWRRWFKPKIPSHIAKELDWLRRDSSPTTLSSLVDELDLAVDRVDLLAVLDPGPVSQDQIVSLAKTLYSGLCEHRRMAWSKALILAAWQNSRMVLTRAGRRLGRPWQTGKTIPSGGLMIALVGSDGSGKSTLSRDLEKWLRYKLDARTFYMGSGDGGSGLFDVLRRGVRSMFRKRKDGYSRDSSDIIGNDRKKHRGTAARVLSLHQLILMHRKLKLLRQARYLVRKGSVVLTDRYPQSQFHGISDGPKLQDGRSFAWAARMEIGQYHVSSQLGPDLILKLQVDPQTAHQRKPDHNIALISRKCQIIEQLSFPRGRMSAIDASQPYEKVLLAAKWAIWSAIREGSSRGN